MSLTPPTLIETSKLRTSPNNPRAIREKAMDKLMLSIAEDPEFMEHHAIVVTPDGEVIDGNQRLRACVALGWTHIPAYVRDYDEEKKRRWMYKANISAGEWDMEMVANNSDPEELQRWGMNIPWDKPSEDEPKKLKQCEHCEKMIP
jgi:hypothetical protein